MFIVARQFADKLDNQHIYNAGDTFPREGVSVEEGRISELLTGRNGKPFIQAVPEASEKPEETLEGSTPVDVPGDAVEAEKKPRKGRKKYAGADSALHT